MSLGSRRRKTRGGRDGRTTSTSSSQRGTLHDDRLGITWIFIGYLGGIVSVSRVPCRNQVECLSFGAARERIGVFIYGAWRLEIVGN